MCFVILVFLQSVWVPSECFVRFMSLLSVLCFALFPSRALALPDRSELSTSADLPGFRDPFLDILKEFFRLLQGLRGDVSTMVCY